METEWPIPVECNPVGVNSAKDMTTPSNKKMSIGQTSPREVNGQLSADRKLDSTVQKEGKDLLHNISVEDILSEPEEETSYELKGLTIDMILDDGSTSSTLPDLSQQSNDFILSEREFNTFIASSDEELC